MEGSKVRTADWLRQWMAMLDARKPGWGRDYDREGFELAIQDLFGSESPRELSEAEFEILGDYAAREGEEAASLYADSLRGSEGFRREMIEFEYIFRSCHGPSSASEELRGMRARAMRNLIGALLAPLRKRFERMARAAGMRELRHARRHPGLPGAPLPDTGALPPEAVALAREAAERVALRAREELAPGAIAAVRAFLRGPAERTACEAAREAGISPATMTRALRKLGEIAARELEGCREPVLKPFTEALVERLGAA
jgi:hypothetical protein